MSIPLKEEPIEFRDESSGMLYILRQPTDEVMIDMDEIDHKYAPTTKERKKLFTKDARAALAWLNEQIGVILSDWIVPENLRGRVEQFADVKCPAKTLRRGLKYALLNRFLSETNIDGDELKNSSRSGTPASRPDSRQSGIVTLAEETPGSEDGADAGGSGGAK